MIHFSAIAATLPLGLTCEREILTKCGLAAGLNPEGLTEIEVRCFLQAYRMRRA